MAHIFFERLERRRSTQTLIKGVDLLQGLQGGWPWNKYDNPISRNLMMTVSAVDTYSRATYPFSNQWGSSLNVPSYFPWESGYSPISNMDLYYGQATRSPISFLMSNLFTITTPKTWDLGIRNGVNLPYQRVSYPEIVTPTLPRDYWHDIVIIYGIRPDSSQENGYPGPFVNGLMPKPMPPSAYYGIWPGLY